MFCPEFNKMVEGEGYLPKQVISPLKSSGHYTNHLL
jgi:hypothetical protein